MNWVLNLEKENISKMKKSLFSILIISTLFLSVKIFSQENNDKIEEEINNILEDKYFNSTLFAIDIFDLTANKPLYKKNEKMLLHPASNMKVLTSAAALEFLGPDYVFTTSLYHSGIIIDSVCYGDIIVEGGFDPDFTSDDLDSLVLSLKEYGIKEIRGNIYGDVSKMDSLFWGEGWMWDDDPSSDFPYMTPLIINDACVEVAYQPGLRSKEVVVSIIPETDYFDISNTSVTTKEDTSNLEVTRDWINRGNEIIIKGDLSFRSKPDTVKMNIVNPEFYFLYLMKEKIEKYNIKFEGRIDTASVPQYSKLIYTFGREYSTVINNLNKESDNLSAEMTLRAMALKYFNRSASAENGVAMIDSLIVRAGLNHEEYRMVDGSGISHYNLVTTELLVEVLRYMYSHSKDNYTILKNSFPAAGVDGTLKNRMRGTKAYNNLFAKTGTLSGVSTLSGYLTSLNNHEIAVSIFFQNFKGSARIARAYQDRICTFLSESEL